MAWYPETCFVEDKADNIADWLSKYPRVRVPAFASVLSNVCAKEIELEAQITDLTREEHLRMVERFLASRELLIQLTSDQRVTVKRSSNLFVI